MTSDGARVIDALDAYRRGTLQPVALARALIGHPRWHLPARGGAGVDDAGMALVPGLGGQWWVYAFTSAEALEVFRAGRRGRVPGGCVVLSGARLAERLPAAAYGVGLDPGSAHAVALGPPAPALLRELGEAVEVEAVLAGRSEAADGFDRLRRYRGYRVAWRGSSIVLAPDTRGRRLVAVFTADDTLGAFVERHGPLGTAAQQIDGTSLYGLLRQTPVDGIVFNCAGPVPPKAVAQAFAAAVLAGVDAPAEAPGPSPGEPGLGSAASVRPPVAAAALPSPELEGVRDVSSYRPRLLRQDAAELARGIVSKPFVSPSDPTQPIVSPMIALVCETADGARYATPKTLGTRRLDELVVDGARQLHAACPPASHRIGAAPGVLYCLGPHAAECLLVREQLLAMHEALGTTEMLAALPMRGVVVACGMNNPLGLMRLSELAKRAARAAGPLGLYDELVLLVRGELMGRASVEVERKPEAASPNVPAVASAPVPVAVPTRAAEPPVRSAAPLGERKAVGGALRARSLAECGLYLELRGWPDDSRTQTMADAGTDVRVSYRCSPPGGGEAEIAFLVRKGDMAATSAEGPVRYGHGPAPSEIIDAGQFFGLAEGFAKASPGSLDRLGKADALAALATIERAAACMDEVVKFIAPGEEMVPESAFFTAAGRATRAAQPAGRWSRARLGAIGGAYRQIADRFRAHAHAEGWLYG